MAVSPLRTGILSSLLQVPIVLCHACLSNSTHNIVWSLVSVADVVCALQAPGGEGWAPVQGTQWSAAHFALVLSRCQLCLTEEKPPFSGLQRSLRGGQSRGVDNPTLGGKPSQREEVTCPLAVEQHPSPGPFPGPQPSG